MRTLRTSLAVLFLLSLSATFGRAQETVAGNDAEHGTTPSDIKTPYFTWGNHKTYLGLDFSFASIQDESLRGSMGRERQTKPAFVIFKAYGDLNAYLSYDVEVNPASDSRRPQPYVPGANDRRTYFFPNQPDSPGGRGVTSVPNGLYEVDDYKHPGADPILQQGNLRVAYIDLHSPSKRFGATIGRVYVPQGLMLTEFAWFTSKDLTHIQQINAQADSGVVLYYDTKLLRVDAAAVRGDANPYHDYAYFDYTGTEDKNSSFGGVVTGRIKLGKYGSVGSTIRRNFLNSRIEDSITLQLSKHVDHAVTVFANLQPHELVRVFGEAGRWTWGLTPSSAVLLAGPAVKSPVTKPGYYIGTTVYTPPFGFGKVGVTLTHEELSRDDALVAWAAANHLFGVTLGKKERSTIAKVQADFGEHLSAFFFYNRLSNPFPELSAIRPIAGPGADAAVSNDKHGLGIRLRF